jgi:hypothetical protein
VRTNCVDGLSTRTLSAPSKLGGDTSRGAQHRIADGRHVFQNGLRVGHIDRCHDGSLAVSNGRRQADDAADETGNIRRVSLLALSRDHGGKRLHRGWSLVGKGLHRDAAVKGGKLAIAHIEEQCTARCHCVAWVTCADRYVPSEAVVGGRAHDINDLSDVAHAHVGGKASAIAQGIDRLATAGHDLRPFQVVDPKGKYLGPELECLGVRKALNVAVSLQRVGHPKRCRAGELQRGCNLGHGDDASLAAEKRQDSQPTAQGRHDIASLLRLILPHHVVEFLQTHESPRSGPEHRGMLFKRNRLARSLAAARPSNKQCDDSLAGVRYGACA